jgi:diguanylate cyclase (GGDEF)-like protein
MPREPRSAASSFDFGPDEIDAAARIVSLFSEEPLHPLRVERVAQQLGLGRTQVVALLAKLERLRVVERKGPPGDIGTAYQLRLADNFLDILERLSRYFTEQLETVAINPERAMISTGEAEAELATLRALRARVANLERANTLLQRKTLELAFLYNTSVLMAGSIEPLTLAQTLLDAVGTATRNKARSFFVALVEKGIVTFQGGIEISRADAEAFLHDHREMVESSIERCSLLSLPPQVRDEVRVPAFALVPLTTGEGEPARGCIVLAELVDEGLNADDLRVLSQLAEIAGRSLRGAALFAQSVSLGSTDELTGAHNRRYLFRRLGEEITRARNTGKPLSVIVMDIDRFKPVNDEFGHPEGDRLLKAATRAIDGATRDVDLVARLGGDEFAVILPGATVDVALKIAERMRTAVEELQFATHAGQRIAVTISCGLAGLHDSTQMPAQLLASADRLLLEAKRSGRNRCVAPQS